MTVANAQTTNTQQDRFNACVYVYEGPSGSWFVQDETDSRHPEQSCSRWTVRERQ